MESVSQFVRRYPAFTMFMRAHRPNTPEMVMPEACRCYLSLVSQETCRKLLVDVRRLAEDDSYLDMLSDPIRASLLRKEWRGSCPDRPTVAALRDRIARHVHLSGSLQTAVLDALGARMEA